MQKFGFKWLLSNTENQCKIEKCIPNNAQSDLDLKNCVKVLTVCGVRSGDAAISVITGTVISYLQQNETQAVMSSVFSCRKNPRKLYAWSTGNTTDMHILVVTKLKKETLWYHVWYVWHKFPCLGETSFQLHICFKMFNTFTCP